MAALLAPRSVAVYEAGSRSFGLSDRRWNDVLAAIRQALGRWHPERPEEAGPTDKSLRAALAENLPADLFAAVLRQLLKTGEVVRRAGQLSLAGHQPAADAVAQAFWARARPLLAADGLRPPTLHELSAALGMEVKEVRHRLLGLARQGLVARVSDKRFFLAEQIRWLAGHAEEASRFTSRMKSI